MGERDPQSFDSAAQSLQRYCENFFLNFSRSSYFLNLFYSFLILFFVVVVVVVCFRCQPAEELRLYVPKSHQQQLYFHLSQVGGLYVT